MIPRTRTPAQVPMFPRTSPTPAMRAIADQYVADLVARRKSGESIRKAHDALERLCSRIPLVVIEDVTKPTIDAWRRARLVDGSSNRTVNLEISILSSALNLAARIGQIDVNPLAGLVMLPTHGRDRRRIGRALHDDEIAQLLEGAERVDERARFPFPRVATIQGLLATAARWNELRQIQWGDVDVGRGAITLRAETTKSGLERTIPIDQGELDRMLALRGAHVNAHGRHPDENTPVFLSATGAPWGQSTSNFRRFLHEAMGAAALARTDRAGRVLHVHALRKTAATRWARDGMPLLELQRIMGHTDPKITAQIYVDAGLEIGRRWISSLPRRASGGTNSRDRRGARDERRTLET